MLAQPLSWDYKNENILYSRISKDLRKVYKYDIYTEMSGPINFYDLSWFEFQRINEEQFIIHAWKKGIYLHDLETKLSQKLVSAEDCRWFYFIQNDKKLIYNDSDTVYMFDPKNKSRTILMKNTAELIIDKVHKTFITVTPGLNPIVDIYYKNEKIVSFQNGFNITVSKDYRYLMYFEEIQETNRTTLHIINLETLKEDYAMEFDGLVQSVNQVENIVHFSLIMDTRYSFYSFDFNNLSTIFHDYRISENQVYSSLSENLKYIALLHDEDGNSFIELIELEKLESNLLN